MARSSEGKTGMFWSEGSGQKSTSSNAILGAANFGMVQTKQIVRCLVTNPFTARGINDH